VNKEEATVVLSKLLGGYRAKSYSDLLPLLHTQNTSEVTADSGTRYQVEFQAVWDDKKDGNLRVMGCIDDRGIRAFVPLTDDFIITPNGEFVGE